MNIKCKLGFHNSETFLISAGCSFMNDQFIVEAADKPVEVNVCNVCRRATIDTPPFHKPILFRLVHTKDLKK